jgi:phosphoglycolate phosphatase-like HAD superfamily hydrolase
MRHVIWDWNGTLVDDLPAVVAAVNVSLADLGAPSIDAEGYRTHYTRPVRVFYDRLLQRSVSDGEWSRIDEVFHVAYGDLLDQIPLTADAAAAIARIEGAGATQSILSMWWHDELAPEVERRGLDTFMRRVDGNTRGAGDTKERLLVAHLELLALTNGAAVLIGDALDDARAAQAAGVRCVLYDGGSHHREELEAAGLPVVSSLVEAASVALES